MQSKMGRVMIQMVSQLRIMVIREKLAAATEGFPPPPTGESMTPRRRKKRIDSPIIERARGGRIEEK